MADKQPELAGMKSKGKKASAVECLGQTFLDDAARREHFTRLLRDKLRDPEFRKLPGFPQGTDEDILRMSDPPYYTACPNPFLADVISHHGRGIGDPPAQMSLAGDFKVDDRDPVYLFHPYHTKVPPGVIRSLIERYTSPGDLVLDVFCGSGMSGVAARASGRFAVLIDLSPVATFISANNCTTHDASSVVAALKAIIADSEATYGWMYESVTPHGNLKVNYFVRTDLFTCPECVTEFPFFPHGVIHHGDKVETRSSFLCPGCGLELNVRKVERIITRDGKKSQIAWVNAGTGRNRISREPSEDDLARQERIDQLQITDWHPLNVVNPDGYTARLAQLGSKRIDDISRFLGKRNLIAFADLWGRASKLEDPSTRQAVLATLTSTFTVISERQGYFGGGGGMSGNLYMPIVRMERNPWDSLRRKVIKLQNAESAKRTATTHAYVSTQSALNIPISDASVDYIYTDPPFGANIIYSEMNLVLEGWLRVLTNADTEAVIDESRRRTFEQYGALMRASFSECYRVLKPGRWITVEFHNTQASIWNLIQSAMGEAGFVVAQVGVLDKGSTTILGDIRPGAAKFDLLITAYRPTQALEQRFHISAGTVEACWAFVTEHLRRVPIHMPEKDGSAEPVPERLPHVLFDRLVAFHVQHRFLVPLSAPEFYRGLAQRYPERDGMYFTPETLGDYDAWRTRLERIQLNLFVSDEMSAIRWLRARLRTHPQTFKEIQPDFLREIQTWSKHERTVELQRLLSDNFLCFDGTGDMPTSILEFLRSRSGGEQAAATSDVVLRRAAEGRWYVPDPALEGDLHQLRTRSLLKEFQQYRDSKERIRTFRIEAVRAGFKAAYDARDYDTIVSVANMLPEEVIHEDETLLMYLDVASTRLNSGRS